MNLKKQAHGGKKPTGNPKDCPMFMNPLAMIFGAGANTGKGKCPFMAGAKKDSKTQKPKKTTTKPVEAMTYEEQLAHVMKLSMEDAKKAEKKTEVKKVKETPKPVEKVEKKKVETPKAPKVVTPKVTPKPAPYSTINHLTFEQQLAAAMKLSLEDVAPK